MPKPAKTPALALEVTLAHTKSTKGTHVYTDSTDEDVPIPSLYIRKSAFPPGGAPPATIVISISAGIE